MLDVDRRQKKEQIHLHISHKCQCVEESPEGDTGEY